MTFHVRTPPVGSRPGTLAIPADAPTPRIHVFDYGPDVCRETSIEDPEELQPFLDTSEATWVDIQGFGDEAKLRRIGEMLGLHILTLATATNVPQRATNQVHSSHQLVVARAPLLRDDGRLEVPQVCVILGKNFVVTFQDRYFGFFDAVRERLRDGIGPMRRLGPGYLTYALLNTLVDHYFPIVEHLATRLEELEEEINDTADAETLRQLHDVRRDLVVIRRIGWPQREAVSAMLRDPSPFLTEEVKMYLRNTEQHVVQIMEAVDSSREMTTGLVDIYLSNVSQRTNEVMKVLTLMASIFIPLTFIAGIYGMNFENMPELQSSLGYPVAISVMILVAVGMLTWFHRKGWFGSGRKGR